MRNLVHSAPPAELKLKGRFCFTMIYTLVKRGAKFQRN